MILIFVCPTVLIFAASVLILISQIFTPTCKICDVKIVLFWHPPLLDSYLNNWDPFLKFHIYAALRPLYCVVFNSTTVQCYSFSNLHDLHSPKRYVHFHGSTGNAEGNPSHGRKLFMLIFSRTTMKISEKAWNVSRMTGKLFMVHCPKSIQVFIIYYKVSRYFLINRELFLHILGSTATFYTILWKLKMSWDSVFILSMYYSTWTFSRTYGKCFT
jgi:hypothetical protein